MREPKYKLNQRDEARLRILITREAVQLGKPNNDFPPLSPAEKLELERLHRKASRKLWAQPRMQKVREMDRKLNRRLRYLSKRLETLTAGLNNSVDSDS